MNGISARIWYKTGESDLFIVEFNGEIREFERIVNEKRNGMTFIGFATINNIYPTSPEQTILKISK